MIVRKPEWLRKKVLLSEKLEMLELLDGLKLSTVCQQALCPNISECFRCGQVTFLILGSRCTRRCSFCNVHQELPYPVDGDEPRRIAEAVVRLKLSSLVITSPTRDDLPDGGSSHFAAVVTAIRGVSPATQVELLIPDFMGNQSALKTVLDAVPAILSHNLETVPRLYATRAGADYFRSLNLLEMSRKIAPQIRTKTGIMLGMGEKFEEVVQVMKDARQVRVDYLSIGHYLPPSRNHYQLQEYIKPEIFEKLRLIGLEMGFAHVESSPFTRSSYHAERYGNANVKSM